MQITVGSLLRGAREAEGTAIIIDVFRAFTTAAVAFSRGAERIVLVAEVADALKLREEGHGDLCMGEVAGMRPDGFDFGNSPFELSQADVAGKRLIQSTRAGTVGVAAATNAEKIYAGSLVIAEATVKVVLDEAPERVSVVAMGAEGKARADEDEQCALYMRNLLLGLRPDREAVRNLVLAGAEAQKYGDPNKPHFDPRDREMAVDIDTIPFAIEIVRRDGLMIATPRTG